MPARRQTSWRRAPVALSLILALFAPNAQAQEASHRFLTLSLWDPISTNRDRDTTTNLRFAVIQSYVHSVRGLDVTGIASQLGGDLQGVQLTGAYSHIVGGGRGVVLAGFGSHIARKFTGLQAGLIMNFNRERLVGLQYSGLANFTSGGISGLQWAGTLNMNDGTGTGWQASSLANVSNDRFVGLQTAGFFNFGNVELKGAQVGGLNWTRHLKGAQVGVVNIAGDARGLQAGLLNFVEQHDGVPVGLFNYAGNGDVDWISWGSNYMGVQSGVRTLVNNWSSILSVGGVYTKETDLQVLSFGWNYGYRFDVSERFMLTVDAGYIHLIPDQDPTLNDRLRPAVQGRAFVEFRMLPAVAVHAGAGITHEWAEYASGAPTETDPLFFGGIALFGGEAR
jgi:hypothetical protein